MIFILLLLTTQIINSSTSRSYILTTISQCRSGIGKPCASNSACQNRVDNTICLNGKCACQTGYIPLGKYLCIPNESTLTSTTTTTTTIIYDSVIGGSCESNTNCQGLVSNAICSNGICTCRTGYVPDGLFNCIRSESSTSTTTTAILIYDSILGGSCESNTNCQGLVNNAICLNGICTCETGYVPNGMVSCVPI